MGTRLKFRFGKSRGQDTQKCNSDNET